MKKIVPEYQYKFILFILIALLSKIIYSENTEIALVSEADSVLVDTLQADSLFYFADSLFYSVPDERIELLNNAKIIYHTSTIEADTISIDLKHDQASTQGSSILKDKNEIVLGSSLKYDLNSKWGIIGDGTSKFDKGYYHGDEIRKIDDEVFDVDNGKFTTCDALHPHFYIHSKKLRLYKNDKIVAKPVVFYVNHFPVMALPFGTFTIKRGRHSGILVPSPGYNKDKGKYIEDIALYFAYKDHLDMLLAYDFYEKTGWQTRFKLDYIDRYPYKGNFEVRLQKEMEHLESYRYEWLITYLHHHNLSNKRTLDVNATFVSSKKIWEGSDDIDERLNEKITSSLHYKQQLWGRSLHISSSYIDDLKNNLKDITLPKISYSLPSKPIYELFINEDKETPENAWWKDFSYSYRFNAIHIGSINDPHPDFWDIIYKGKKDSAGYVNQHNVGVKHIGGLYYRHKLFSWLDFNQSFSLNEAWFDRDEDGKKYVRGNDYSTSSSLSLSLYE